jgi:hypothetical protein
MQALVWQDTSAVPSRPTGVDVAGSRVICERVRRSDPPAQAKGSIATAPQDRRYCEGQQSMKLVVKRFSAEDSDRRWLTSIRVRHGGT